jgi:hypothetical protein
VRRTSETLSSSVISRVSSEQPQGRQSMSRPRASSAGGMQGQGDQRLERKGHDAHSGPTALCSNDDAGVTLDLPLTFLPSNRLTAMATAPKRIVVLISGSGISPRRPSSGVLS